MTKTKNKSIVDQMRELAAQLTTENHDELSHLGWVVPYAEAGAEINDDPRWGVRCAHCGKIALVFIGQKFRHRDGSVDDHPDIDIPVDQQPWTQDSVHIDRYNPACQHCGQKVQLRHRSFRKRDMVNLGSWYASRDAGMQMLKEHRKLARRGRQGPPGTGIADPGGVSGHALHNQKVSAFLPEGAAEKIETIERSVPLFTPGGHSSGGHGAKG